MQFDAFIGISKYLKNIDKTPPLAGWGFFVTHS